MGTKIVINSCYGGFSISREAAQYMAERGHAQAAAELAIKGEFYGYGYIEGYEYGYRRDDPLLVEAVETLGKAANGSSANLSVVEVPSEVEWYVEEYDGCEHIAEKHRTWR